MTYKNREHIYMFYGYIEPSIDCDEDTLTGQRAKYEEVFEEVNRVLEGKIVPIKFINSTDFVGATYSSLSNLKEILNIYMGLIHPDLPKINLQISTELRLNDHYKYANEMTDYIVTKLLKNFKSNQTKESYKYKNTILDTANVSYNKQSLELVNTMIELLINEFLDLRSN